MQWASMADRAKSIKDRTTCLTPEAVASYIDSTLDDGATRQITAHLKVCAACRRLVDAHQADERLAAGIRDAFDAGTVFLPLESTSEPAPPIKPDAITGYEIRDEIHRGGQGVVFEALQKATRRTVALKVLLHGAFASNRQRRRFEREIEMVAGLQHPHIVTVYDSGLTSDSRPYLAMEYIDGVPLDKYVDARQTEVDPHGSAGGGEKPLTLREGLQLFLKVCAAVAYAHQHGVIHRDLKPSNILIDREGEPHVLDFGLAKDLETPPADGKSVTLAGEFMGTVAYASPEQINLTSTLDVRSDVYSLGVILYEMLTGRFPYQVTGPIAEIFNRITSAQPEAPSAWHRRRSADGQRAAAERSAFRIDNDLETIILKCLSKPLERRYQSVDELTRDIRHYLANEPIEAKRDSGWYVLRKTVYKHRMAALVVIAFLAVIAEAVIVSVIHRNQAIIDRDRVAHAEQAVRERMGQAERARHRAEQQRDHYAAVADFQGSVLWGLDPERFGQNVIDDLRERIRLTATRTVQDAESRAELLAAVERILQRVEPGDFGRDLLDQNLLRQVGETLAEKVGDRSLVEAEIREQLGIAYWQHGDYGLAEPHLFRAFEVYGRERGDRDSTTIAAMHHLGLLYRDQQRYDEAETMLVQTLELARQVRGDKHPFTVQVSSDLARLSALQGRDEKALRLAGAVVGAARDAFNPRDPQLAEYLAAYGALSLKVGQFEAAEAALHEAYEIFTTARGADHAQTRRVADLLVQLYEQQQEPAAAAEWRKRLEDDPPPDAAGRPE
jgi:serine/threonine protein kinase